MGSAEWWSPLAPKSIRVTVRCEYPGTDLASTAVTFTPGSELGADPAAVHASILLRLALCEQVFLPLADDRPIEVWSETVRAVVVR